MGLCGKFAKPIPIKFLDLKSRMERMKEEKKLNGISKLEFNRGEQRRDKFFCIG